jgi:hypothetical protein
MDAMKRVLLVFTLWAVPFLACTGGETEKVIEPKLSAIRKEIFEPRCSSTSCHGAGASPAADLNLLEAKVEDLVDADSTEDPLFKRVVAGDPDNSLLYLVLLGPQSGVRQMPVGAELDDVDLEAIKTWIEDGAKDD